MFKLSHRFRGSHGNISQTSKIQFKIPTSLTPVSHFRDGSKTLVPDSEQGFVLGLGEKVAPEDRLEEGATFKRESKGIFHPWPEWIELMRRLLRSGYFEPVGNPFRKGKLEAEDAKRIRTACLNFARDRFDLIRYFARTDIQIIAGSGCPNIDRKVVNSGKRLRAYVGVDEENVCSSCNLRGNCDRAYVNACGQEGAQTVDVMRFLLVFGLDLVAGTVENKQCVNKTTTESVRRLLKEMAGLSKKETDCDQPNDTFMQYPEERLVSSPFKQETWTSSENRLFQGKVRKRRGNRDCIPLKRGDWICDGCNFLNYAKNIKCLQCNKKPPKRQLNPGEWECDSCNYINFRRNAVCLKCEYRRPRALNSDYAHLRSSRDDGNP
ncbi:hypothetical protein NMG60_11018763 [Bertholletia excelsa]